MTMWKLAPEVDAILTAKRDALAERRQKTPLNAVRALASMRERAHPFLCECDSANEKPPLLVGQIHYTPEPHAGPYDPVAQAVRYVHAGVEAIALFTDTTTSSGEIDDLMFVARAVQPFAVPVISQDFIFDEYQVVEARAAGAAGLVLDPALLDPQALRILLSSTQRNRMTAIIRVGNESELETALALSPEVISLGSAPLSSTPAEAQQLARLRAQVPGHVNVMLNAEKLTLEDLLFVAGTGIDAVIIGGSLLTDDLPRLRALLDRPQPLG